MAGGGARGDDELITDINVTPLVDIVLVLLIVMMVTSSYLVNKSINVELPKAATGETTSPTLSISIDVENQLYLDGTVIESDALQARIRDTYKKDPDLKAIISADGRVQHSQVVSIIDMLRREKITKFAINTSPIEDAKGQ